MSPERADSAAHVAGIKGADERADALSGGFVSFCWCGEKRAWFSDLFFTSCGGTGYMDCLCGGDFCCCHNHGGMECPGCDECEGALEEWE